MSLDAIQDVASAYAAAWSSRSPEAVASFFAETGEIAVNRGDVIEGRPAIARMAAGYFADIPDLVVHCDGVRCSAHRHAIFLWTFEGHHTRTKKWVRVRGWEEWDLDHGLKIRSSRGWYDAQDYERQIVEAASEMRGTS